MCIRDRFWDNEEEDGLDIYLDAVKHFPDNSSIVKIVAKVLDHNMKDVEKPITLFPKIEKSTY